MSRSRRSKRQKRAPQAARPGPRDPLAQGQAHAARRTRSPKDILFTLAPLLILLALFIFVSTGPEPPLVRAVFGVFFLGWGAVLIVLGGLRLARRGTIQPSTAQELMAQRVRTYMYLGGGVVFGVIGLLVLLGVITLNVGGGQ